MHISICVWILFYSNQNSTNTHMQIDNQLRAIRSWRFDSCDRCVRDDEYEMVMEMAMNSTLKRK